MTDTDFDFDFDLGRRRASPRPPAAGSAVGPEGNGRSNGAARRGSRGKDPFDSLDDPSPSASPRAPASGRGGGLAERLRSLGGAIGGDGGRQDSPSSGNGAGPGDGNGAGPGDGNGAGPGDGARRSQSDDGARASGDGRGVGDGLGGATGAAAAPARGAPGPAPRRRFAPGGSESRPPAGEDDWLSLADEVPAGGELDSIARPGDGPAGPRTPGEGRKIARAARRRATGRTGDFEAGRAAARPRRGTDEDFESVLEHQPQKGGLARRGSALSYGLRGLLDSGRERVRGAGGRISALRERVPSQAPGTAGGGAPPPPRLPKRLSSRRPRKPKPGRVKKLRLAIILIGLGLLAGVATVFGMMMSVAGDLPQLENKEQYAKAKNSEVFDSEGRKIGTLLSNSQRILLESQDISPYIKQAVVAIEDQRFYEHDGVDFQGIARALFGNVIPGGTTSGASTISQQFVKNALAAQDTRTYFQKLREAAYAYHLERQWDKDKILTSYLNTIYFGEGAYGIEAAARTYFGYRYPGCGEDGADPCSSQLAPEEAALLAGIISSPAAYSPRTNPVDSGERRNLVLQRMNEQGYLTDAEYQDAAIKALPAPSEIQKPTDDSLSPYFTSWLRQQVVDKYGAGRAFGGGLDVHSTLDLDMQESAESIAYNTLAGIAPTASVVVIDNETGGVKAMVGGNDYEQRPFNLATNGHRQPGSSFKPFTLITAFENGFGPGSQFVSQKRVFTVPNSKGKEFFEVNNYDDIYYGTSDLVSATLHSDNSIFAELGFGPSGLGRKGPDKIGRTAVRMGINPESFDRKPATKRLDTNPAMILGGIDPGVTPLEMAYAYSTIARGGMRVGGELDSVPGPNESLQDLGPTAITEVVLPDGKTLDGGKEYNQKELRAIPQPVADSVKSILRSNVVSGTGERAQTGSDDAWGKTGTTDNNGDAWFCGGTEHFTACVWVGHFDTNTPMETEFGGLPVDGGTFPALIWSQVMQSMESIYDQRAAGEDDDVSGSSGGYVPSTGGGYSGGSGGGSSGGGSAQAAPAPAAPAPSPAPAPSTGGTGGTGL